MRGGEKVNTIDMLFKQMPLATTAPRLQQQLNQTSMTDNQTFKQLLNQSQPSDSISAEKISSHQEIASIRQLVSGSLGEMSEANLLLPLNDEGLIEDISGLLLTLPKSTDDLMQNVLPEEMSSELAALLEEFGLSIDDLDLLNLGHYGGWQSLQLVLLEISSLLEESNLEQLPNKDWVQLLDRLSSLPQDLRNALLSNKLTNEEEQLVKTLLTKFELKTIMAEKGYSTHSKVTSEDLSKWLQQALSRQTPKAPQTFAESFAMSKDAAPLEQLTLQLSQTALTHQQTFNEELFQQFEQVLAKMHVGKGMLGHQQLTLQLNPHNLGQITIEMSEIDGEMYVKLIASSAGAKEALEANIRELRHMFSPHQVLIEQEEHVATVSPSDLPDYQEQEQHEPSHNDSKSRSEDEEDTNTRFSDLLYQEEVSL